LLVSLLLFVGYIASRNGIQTKFIASFSTTSTTRHRVSLAPGKLRVFRAQNWAVVVKAAERFGKLVEVFNGRRDKNL
jgi:hypothetical protein